MNREDLKQEILFLFQKEFGEGYYDYRTGCIDGYYDLDEISYKIVDLLTNK